ncbi:MAG: hypothetical protein ACTSV7_00815 [Candidatus Baldrarchaeia archaeon]
MVDKVSLPFTLFCTLSKYSDKAICKPKNKNFVLVEVSGGEYEERWEIKFVCPKTKLDEIKSKLEKTNWNDGPEHVLISAGCVETELRPFISFHRTYPDFPLSVLTEKDFEKTEKKVYGGL